MQIRQSGIEFTETSIHHTNRHVLPRVQNGAASGEHARTASCRSPNWIAVARASTSLSAPLSPAAAEDTSALSIPRFSLLHHAPQLSRCIDRDRILMWNAY
jgi:hypothetical protein